MGEKRGEINGERRVEETDGTMISREKQRVEETEERKSRQDTEVERDNGRNKIKQKGRQRKRHERPK